MSIMTKKKPVSICTKGSKMRNFSNFGGLARGLYYKDIHEAKLHIGSVLSGLDAGKVNTDPYMSV